MSEVEHIKDILPRALRELAEGWKEQKEGKKVEVINQESPVESSAV